MPDDGPRKNLRVYGVVRTATGLSDHDIIYVVRKLNYFGAERRRVIQKIQDI